MYVDAIIKKGEDYLTSEDPACKGKDAVVQHGGSLENAIRSHMPGLNEEDLAAEEIVDSILRIEINEGKIPAEVCCPAHNAAWEDHSQVVCRKKQL